MGLFKFVLSGAGAVVPGSGFDGVITGVVGSSSKMMIAPHPEFVQDWVNGAPVAVQFEHTWFQGVHRVA